MTNTTTNNATINNANVAKEGKAMTKEMRIKDTWRRVQEAVKISDAEYVKKEELIQLFDDCMGNRPGKKTTRRKLVESLELLVKSFDKTENESVSVGDLDITRDNAPASDKVSTLAFVETTANHAIWMAQEIIVPSVIINRSQGIAIAKRVNAAMYQYASNKNISNALEELRGKNVVRLSNLMAIISTVIGGGKNKIDNSTMEQYINYLRMNKFIYLVKRADNGVLYYVADKFIAAAQQA